MYSRLVCCGGQSSSLLRAGKVVRAPGAAPARGVVRAAAVRPRCVGVPRARVRNIVWCCSMKTGTCHDHDVILIAVKSRQALVECNARGETPCTGLKGAGSPGLAGEMPARVAVLAAPAARQRALWVAPTAVKTG